MVCTNLRELTPPGEWDRRLYKFFSSPHYQSTARQVNLAFSISGAPQGPSRIEDTLSWLKKYLQFPIYLSHGTIVTHTASIWQKFFVVQNVELLVLSSSSWGWIACLPCSIQLHLFPYFGAPRFKSPFVRNFFSKKKRKRKDFHPSTWRKGRGVTREEIVEKKNCIHANQKNAATYK